MIARGETPGTVETNADQAPTGRRRPSTAGFRRPVGASADSFAHEPGVAPLASILCPLGAEMVCSKPGPACEDSEWSSLGGSYAAAEAEFGSSDGGHPVRHVMRLLRRHYGKLVVALTAPSRTRRVAAAGAHLAVVYFSLE